MPALRALHDALDTLHASVDDLCGDLVETTAAQNWEGLAKTIDNLSGERDFILPIVQVTGKALEFSPPFLIHDKEVVTAAVKQYWPALQWASDKLKMDGEVVFF